MRRTLFLTLASVAVFAFVPASAFARKHHRHHRQHHVVRVHHKRFGTISSPSSSSTGSTPSTPSVTPSTDTAGKVASFDGTTLVLTLNDNSTVSGKVTGDTEIECQSSQPMQSFQGDDGSSGGGEDQGAGNQGGDDQGDGQGGGDQGDDNEGQGNPSCTTANLTPGTTVVGAELKISSGGSIWDKVELMLP